MKRPALAFFILSMSAKLALGDATNNLGIFSDQADIGSVAKAGSVSFDPANGEYLIAGGGENMWFTNDAFHYRLGKNVGRPDPCGGHQVSGHGRKPASQGLPRHPPVTGPRIPHMWTWPCTVWG